MIGVVQLSFLKNTKIDITKTAQNVKDFFEHDFDHYLNLSGKHRSDLSSPQMDITGITAHNGVNHQDESMAVNIDADNCVLAVDHTISSCSNSGDKPYGTILYLSYIKNISNYAIAQRLGYQTTRYYELKNRALVEFAERMELYRKRDHTSIEDLRIFEDEQQGKVQKRTMSGE